jgi:hypothetical protein
MNFTMQIAVVAVASASVVLLCVVVRDTARGVMRFWRARKGERGPQCSTHCSRRSHLAAMRNPRRANRAVPGRDIASRLDAERRQAMPYSISTLLIRNLRDVFGENDPEQLPSRIPTLCRY